MEINCIFSLATIRNSDKFAFGKNNDLVVKSSSDLQHFKSKTQGHVLIMGRKTFESLGSKTLPNRQSIVITSANYEDEPDGCYFETSLDNAIKFAKDFIKPEKVFIIGGKGIITEAINKKYVDNMYITLFETHILQSDDIDVIINNHEIDDGKSWEYGILPRPTVVAATVLGYERYISQYFLKFIKKVK